jgi:hypothetical protein
VDTAGREAPASPPAIEKALAGRSGEPVSTTTTLRKGEQREAPAGNDVTTVLYLLCAVLVAFVLYTASIHRRRLREASSHDIEQVKADLMRLLKRGYHGAVMWLKEPSGTAEIEFSKYISEYGETGLELRIRRPSLDSARYTALQDLIISAPGVDADGLRSGQEASDQIVVDFGQDVQAATAVAAKIFEQIFLQSSMRVTVHAVDICPLDEPVTRRDHPRAWEIVRTRLPRKNRGSN